MSSHCGQDEVVSRSAAVSLSDITKCRIPLPPLIISFTALSQPLIYSRSKRWKRLKKTNKGLQYSSNPQSSLMSTLRCSSQSESAQRGKWEPHPSSWFYADTDETKPYVRRNFYAGHDHRPRSGRVTCTCLAVSWCWCSSKESEQKNCFSSQPAGKGLICVPRSMRVALKSCQCTDHRWACGSPLLIRDLDPDILLVHDLRNHVVRTGESSHNQNWITLNCRLFNHKKNCVWYSKYSISIRYFDSTLGYGYRTLVDSLVRLLCENVESHFSFHLFSSLLGGVEKIHKADVHCSQIHPASIQYNGLWLVDLSHETIFFRETKVWVWNCRRCSVRYFKVISWIRCSF
jgi:hypothetical protein